MNTFLVSSASIIERFYCKLYEMDGKQEGRISVFYPIYLLHLSIILNRNETITVQANNMNLIPDLDRNFQLNVFA